MKIKVMKRKGSVTLKFSAESEIESVDLKDIVLAASRNDMTVGSTMAELKARGYTGVLTKDAPSLKVFELKRGA